MLFAHCSPIFQSTYLFKQKSWTTSRRDRKECERKIGPGWKREKQIIQEAIGGRVKKWKECRKDRRKWVKRWKRKSKNGGYRREQGRKEEKGGAEMCLKSWENLLVKLLSVNESRQVELEGAHPGKTPSRKLSRRPWKEKRQYWKSEAGKPEGFTALSFRDHKGQYFCLCLWHATGNQALGVLWSSYPSFYLYIHPYCI